MKVMVPYLSIPPLPWICWSRPSLFMQQGALTSVVRHRRMLQCVARIIRLTTNDSSQISLVSRYSVVTMSIKSHQSTASPPPRVASIINRTFDELRAPVAQSNNRSRRSYKDWWLGDAPPARATERRSIKLYDRPTSMIYNHLCRLYVWFSVCIRGGRDLKSVVQKSNIRWPIPILLNSLAYSGLKVMTLD